MGAPISAYRDIHRWPLRARIIAVLAALLGAAMFTVGLAVSWELNRYMLQREDSDLRLAAHELVTPAVIAEIEQEQGSARVSAPSGVYAIAVTTPKGMRVHQPLHGPQADFGVVSTQSVAEHEGKPFTIGSLGEDGEQWRVVEGTESKSGYPYAVAASLETAHGVVHKVQLLTMAVSTGALVTAIAAALFAVARALRPLRDIEDTAAAIAAGDITRRVPNPRTADEIESLSRSLNLMLAQLERSMEVKDRSEESMRRFVADASHELRTPLATVRGYAELYRQGAMHKPDDVAAGFKRIEDEAQRMSAMVENLLLLSRLETEQRAASIGSATPGISAHHPVDLTVLAMDAVTDARARKTGRTLTLSGPGGALGPAMVLGDDQRLRQVMTNLITNAERYTPSETPIDVSVGPRDGHIIFEVRDHGPGIPIQQRERVFERFYRADEARNRASGSTGLGLSIVSAIVESHHGSIAVTETPGGGATFTLQLPPLETAGLPVEENV